MTTIPLTVSNANKNVVPIPDDQVPPFLPPNTRMTDTGLVDVLDVLETLYPSRDTARKALHALLEITERSSANGFNSDSITRVRWQSQRGRFASLVCPINTLLIIAMTLRSRGCGELRAAVASSFLRRAMIHGGRSEAEINKLLAPTPNSRLTDMCEAAIGTPVVTPRIQEPVATSGTSDGSISVTINRSPRRLSPTHEDSEDGRVVLAGDGIDTSLVPIKAMDLGTVTTQLERFERISSVLMSADQRNAFVESTLGMYSQVNKAIGKLATERARSMELDNQAKRLKLNADQRERSLKVVRAGADLLNREKAMTLHARHSLGRKVVEIIGGTSSAVDTPLEIDQTAAAAIQSVNVIPTSTAPLATASEHFASLLGSPYSGNVLKNLEKDVFNALKLSVGVDAVHMRGKRAKNFKYKESELMTMDSIFQRYVNMVREMDANDKDDQ